MGLPLKRAAALEWRQPESMRQTVCVMNGRGQEMGCPKLVGVQKIVSESLIQDMELEGLIYNAGVLFCFGFIVTVPWFFPHEIRKCVTYF